MSDDTTRIIKCPRCRRMTRYDRANPFRPFCSARCKNDDIVGWAEERHRVPGEPITDVGELDELLSKLPQQDPHDDE